MKSNVFWRRGMASKLPKGWAIQNVNDVALKVQYGYTGKVIEKGSHFYLRITDIQNGKVNWNTVPFCDIDDKNIGNYELNYGDILFARTGGTVGKSFLYKENEKSIFASYLIRVVPNLDKVIAEYLYLFFQSPLYWLQIRDAELGAAQPNVNGTKLAKITFPLPPLPEQHRIVTKLNELFERIDKAIALVQENIKHAESLMSSVLEDVFKKLKKNCKWVELETVSNLITKGSSPKWQGVNYTEKSKDSILFITSENVGSFHLITDNMKYVEAKFNQIEKKSILKKGDILMNIVGASIGRTAVYYLDEVANINQAVCLIRLDNLKIENDYALFFFNSPLCLYYMDDKQVDNARANLSMGNIKKFLIPLPSINEQKKITNHLVKIQRKKESLLIELNNRLSQLQQLKSSLLDAAFKGEL